MNKQMIEIEVPEGKKAVWKDGKIIFEDIAPKLPETWEEFCKFYPVKAEEVFIGSDSKFLCCEGTRFCFVNRNVLPSLEAAQAHLAYPSGLGTELSLLPSCRRRYPRTESSGHQVRPGIRLSYQAYRSGP